MHANCVVVSMLAAAALAPTESGAQAPRPLDPNCAKLLPAATVAQVSGDKDVALIPPGAVPAAGGTCNYAVGGRTVILYVDLSTFADARTFQRYKNKRSYQERQQAIPGLGDEAFSASPSNQDMVVARKGKTLIAMLAMLDLDPKSARLGKPHLTRAQLIELARRMLATL